MRKISKSRQIKLLLLDLEVQEIKNLELEKENQRLKKLVDSKNSCLVAVIRANSKMTSKLDRIKNILLGGF